jgi:nucleoside-diphosphate-sugar epimerase|tara:strand:+ start:44 stop:1021 length:978 start_codon:yes stop_codon:yes gene_type:complete
MRRVLITGGAGFMGYHLAKRLEKNDFYIDLIDDLSRGKIDKDFKYLIKKKNIRFNNIDINSNNFFSLKKRNYDYIFHFAAIVGVKNVIKKPLEVLTKNIFLLERILNFSKKQKKLKRLIFTSSSEIYAGTLKKFGLKFPTPEETTLTLNKLDDQRSTYMMSKIYGEAMCHHSKIPFTIIRPHNIYGPRMGRSHVIPELFIKAQHPKEKILEVYSPYHKRTFCYVDDAINMIINLSKSKLSKNKIFNIGNDKNEIKIIDLAKLILIISKKKLKILPMQIDNGSPYRRWPSIKKYKRIDNKIQFTSLKVGLKNTLGWYLNNNKSKII